MIEPGIRHPTTGKLSIHPQGRIRQRKERIGSAFHLLCPRYSGPLAPTAIRLLETSTLFFQDELHSNGLFSLRRVLLFRNRIRLQKIYCVMLSLLYLFFSQNSCEYASATSYMIIVAFFSVALIKCICKICCIYLY